LRAARSRGDKRRLPWFSKGERDPATRLWRANLMAVIRAFPGLLIRANFRQPENQDALESQPVGSVYYHMGLDQP
jgi:hypothetical protein